MADKKLLLMITCEEAAAASLLTLLANYDPDAQSSPQRNLDGAVVTEWLVLAGVAIKTAPDLLRALTEFVRRNQVRRIEINGIVVDNPRAEDVDKLMEKILSTGKALPDEPAGLSNPGVSRDPDR